MEETAPQRYELPNAPPNKALIFLPWKSKGDTKRRQGTPPKSRSRKHHIHFPSRFFNFQFSDLPTCHHFRPQRINPQRTNPDRSHRNARIYVPNNVAVNYATHGKKTPKTPNMSLIWVLPRVTETALKNFLPKIACFLVC